LRERSQHDPSDRRPIPGFLNPYLVNKFGYDNCSFSIYKNNDAIATAGKTSPTSGTRIDGRFKLIICFTFSKI
jgi:hypothetical protein